MGWNEAGLLVTLRTAGKKQAPWCRESRVGDSDGLSLLIDTRDMHDIHRAGRFCHRFVFLPQGAGRMLNEPVAQLVEIPRAAKTPGPHRPAVCRSVVRNEAMATCCKPRSPPMP